MTAHGTIRSAVQALREGAEDYLTKPIDVEELEHLLDRILKRNRLLTETRLLRQRLDEKYRFENIIGRSPEMMEVFRLIEQVAPSQASILITGESGTGKELIAQAIHQHSPRRDAPFVKVSCAALPETLLESELFGHERGAFTGALARRAGRFEIAAGGTVFLDEIGDVPAGMQVKLLRFLQERQFERLGGNRTLTVDVRVIAATHRTLPALIREGRFREDLYYRLNVIEIPLPSLRSAHAGHPPARGLLHPEIRLAQREGGRRRHRRDAGRPHEPLLARQRARAGARHRARRHPLEAREARPGALPRAPHDARPFAQPGGAGRARGAARADRPQRHPHDARGRGGLDQPGRRHPQDQPPHDPVQGQAVPFRAGDPGQARGSRPVPARTGLRPRRRGGAS